MSMRITEDSATPAQVYNLTLAFQRTAGLGLPAQITDLPVVKVAGSAMNWQSPGMSAERCRALLAEFDRLERGVFHGPTSDNEPLITGKVTEPWPGAFGPGKKDGTSDLDLPVQHVAPDDFDGRLAELAATVNVVNTQPDDDDDHDDDHDDAAWGISAGLPDYEEDAVESVPEAPDAVNTQSNTSGLPWAPANTWWDFETFTGLDSCDFWDTAHHECAGPRVGVERKISPEGAYLSAITGRVRCEKHVANPPK